MAHIVAGNSEAAQAVDAAALLDDLARRIRDLITLVVAALPIGPPASEATDDAMPAPEAMAPAARAALAEPLINAAAEHARPDTLSNSSPDPFDWVAQTSVAEALVAEEPPDGAAHAPPPSGPTHPLLPDIEAVRVLEDDPHGLFERAASSPATVLLMDAQQQDAAQDGAVELTSSIGVADMQTTKGFLAEFQPSNSEPCADEANADQERANETNVAKKETNPAINAPVPPHPEQGSSAAETGSAVLHDLLADLRALSTEELIVLFS